MNLTDTTGADEGDPAWSPDGAILAFARENRSSPPGGSSQLYSMTTESSRARRLTDLPGGAAKPAWSPGGMRIAFEWDGDIYVMNADGSRLRGLVNLHSPSAALGAPHPGYGNFEPSWSPDGTKLVFASDRDGDSDLYVMPPDGTEDQAIRLTDLEGDESLPAWRPAPISEPAPVTSGSPVPDVLADDVLVCASQDEDFHTDLFIIGENGSGHRNLTNSPNTYERDPAWSPDGTKVVFSGGEGKGIWVIHADGTDLAQLTSNSDGMDEEPAWSPDGTKIAFTRSGSGGERDILVMNADGSSPTPLTAGETSEFSPTWSPDGRWIAFSVAGPGEAPYGGIWKVPAGGGQPVLVLDQEGAVRPAWSPDGGWIAFDSARIWLVRPDGTDAHPITRRPLEVSEASPAWSPDGTRLAFDRASDSNDLWIMNADGTDPQQLATGPANCHSPAWRTDNAAPRPVPPASVDSGPDCAAVWDSVRESAVASGVPDGEARRLADEARAECEADGTASPPPTATTAPPTEASPCLDEHARRNAPPPNDPSKVAVYFSCSGDPGIEGEAVHMLERALPDPQMSLEERLEFALDQLLRGPSAGEGKRGYVIAVAPFRDGIRDIAITDGHATVDLTSEFQQRTECCETTQGIIFRGELLATVFQFEEIESVRFLSGGDCDAFWHHFESTCQDVERPLPAAPFES
jgi:Tol biopolymer transport system component